MKTTRSSTTEVRLFTEAENKILAGAINASDRTSPYVQILKVGSFIHPQYGKFEVTTEKLKQLKENFDKKVRKIDVAIDYSHENEEQAAGWITELFLAENGSQLWAVVDWTPKARTMLADKEFRYFSSEFADDYVDNETGQSYKNVLLGGGLTNRPFIKGMEAIQLKESKGDNKMKTIEQLETENKTLTEKVTGLEKKLADMPQPDPNKEAMIKELEGKIEEMKKKIEELQGSNNNLLEEKKLAEQKGEFDKMLSEGKACEAQREAFMKKDFKAFAEKAQPVNLEGKGGSGGGKDDNTDASAQVMKLAEEKVKAEKIDLGTAVSKVLSENKELAKKYYEQ